MSASSKKKLRNEERNAKLTERQLAEQKEAKKLKLYTTIFAVVMVVLLVVAVVFGITNFISNSGNRERNTVAVTVGEHEISNAEYNYYFIDSINALFSGDNSYMLQLGLLDTSLPLDEQVNPLNGQNWAEYVMEYAAQNITSNYALVDAAKAAGYTISEDVQLEIDTLISNQEFYASMYGYSDVDSFLKASYGKGASLESYRQYVETSMLSQAYYNEYVSSLDFEESDLRAKEAEGYNKFSSFTYNYYYLTASKFLEGGNTDADGNTTYTDEETAASIKACEEAAKSLIGDEITTAEELDAAISALSINAGSETPVTSTLYSDTLYTNIASQEVAEWISAENRKEGDKVVLPNEVTSTDAKGNTVNSINGYYVLFFHGSDDNTFALKNARHILAAFEGGSYDSATGITTYSDEEKAAAKAAAEDLLAQWKAGDATEESFAALANEHSADGDGTTGGLYEDIYPGQMVPAFDLWCYDDSRKAGDTGIVETEYGFHVMYFSENSETTYRDYMIENQLRNDAVTSWYNGLVESVSVVEGDTSYVYTDVVLGGSN